MNSDRHTLPAAVLSADSAVWPPYAGLVQGMRWRRHLEARPPPVTAAAPQRLRGAARR